MALTFTPNPSGTESCPDFSLPAVTGGNYSLSDFTNGKPLVVMFICNHCPYVKAIEDRLIQLGHDLKKLDVNCVAICANDPLENPEDSFENLKARALEKKYSFVYLHDKDQKTAHLFQAVCTPDFFVYTADLKLQYRGRLDDNWKDASKVTKRELYEAVKQLIDGKNIISSKQIPSMGCSIKWSK